MIRKSRSTGGKFVGGGDDDDDDEQTYQVVGESKWRKGSEDDRRGHLRWLPN